MNIRFGVRSFCTIENDHPMYNTVLQSRKLMVMRHKGYDEGVWWLHEMVQSYNRLSSLSLN